MSQGDQGTELQVRNRRVRSNLDKVCPGRQVHQAHATGIQSWFTSSVDENPEAVAFTCLPFRQSAFEQNRPFREKA
jgi:hypothetical protein